MTTKKLIAASAVFVTVSAASFVAGIAIAKGPAKAPELTPFGELSWTPLMKEGVLPAGAPIEGDAAKGAFMGYLKLPAGFESPPHSHTSDYWTVLVQGQMTHWAADGGSEKDSKAIGVGGWVHMPGKLVHISKCYPGADCVMVIMQKGKNDFIPAPAPKK
jgi:quercetin dioxygenase-like cupin family protein